MRVSKTVLPKWWIATDRFWATAQDWVHADWVHADWVHADWVHAGSLVLCNWWVTRLHIKL